MPNISMSIEEAEIDNIVNIINNYSPLLKHHIGDVNEKINELVMNDAICNIKSEVYPKLMLLLDDSNYYNTLNYAKSSDTLISTYHQITNDNLLIDEFSLVTFLLLVLMTTYNKDYIFTKENSEFNIFKRENMNLLFDKSKKSSIGLSITIH